LARILRTDVVEVNVLLDGLGEIGRGLASVRRSVSSVERARDLAASMTDQLATLRLAGARSAGGEIEIDKLSVVADRMSNLLDAAERGLGADVDAVERELRQARDTAERLRLSPASSLFNALERTVRDAANSLGKNVSFQASGGDVRLDGQVLDTIQSALVQVVRNAVAHGIESPDRR